MYLEHGIQCKLGRVKNKNLVPGIIQRAFFIFFSLKHTNLEKKNIQLEAKNLNRYFATINADYLDQNSIKKLLFI